MTWSIWYNRNQVVNENCDAVAERVWGLAICLTEDFKEANIQLIKPKGQMIRPRNLLLKMFILYMWMGKYQKWKETQELEL